MNPLDTFGINWKVLIGQIINLVILFFLLQRFAFKPFLKVLSERREKIEKGVKLAEESKEKIKLAEEEKAKILKEGEEKARQILKESERRGKQKEKEILATAEAQKVKILEQAQQIAQEEIEKRKREFFQKNLELVLAVSEKILKEKIDSKKDKEVIENLLTSNND